MVQISMAFQGSKSITEYVRYARLMENYDFDQFLVYDDVMYRPCWPILFTVAQHTTKMQVGPCVTHPYFRHPVVTASNIACLDELTHGRAVLGIGRGAFYEQYGVDAPKPINGVKETVEIVSRFLTGDRAEYKGRVFHISEGATLAYKPVRKAVPIFIGTWGPKLSQLAAELKAVSEVRVDTLWHPAYLPLIANAVTQGARLAGRDSAEVGIAVGPQTSVSKDREAARSCIRKTLPDYLSFPQRLPMALAIGIDRGEIDAVTQAVLMHDSVSSGRLITDGTIDKLAAVGTPEDVIHGAERMIRSGVTHISFCHPHGPDVEEAIQLIGQEVIPHLK